MTITHAQLGTASDHLDTLTEIAAVRTALAAHINATRIKVNNSDNLEATQYLSDAAVARVAEAIDKELRDAALAKKTALSGLGVDVSGIVIPAVIDA